MLRTVLRNLIANAIKFTARGGQIKVSAAPQADGIELSVSDTGIGIHEEDIHKLWLFSEQFTTAGTNGEKGTGLGLMICKDFIDAHGGKIWVESEFGKGSTFKFTIPYGGY